MLSRIIEDCFVRKNVPSSLQFSPGDRDESPDEEFGGEADDINLAGGG